MKITDPEVIKNGEKDLIDSVQQDLDLDAVRGILKERMAVAALGSKGGQIVVHDNQIAFRLDFEVNLSGSLLFDRDGNFIDETLPSQDTQDQDMTEPVQEDLALEDLAEADLEPGDDIQEETFAISENEDIVDLDPEIGIDSGLDETLDPEEDLVDDLSIELPDYDLEDESNEDPELDLEAIEEEDDLTQDSEFELDPEPEEESGIDIDDPESQDLDDDINDILQESREFWETKKNS